MGSVADEERATSTVRLRQLCREPIGNGALDARLHVRHARRGTDECSHVRLGHISESLFARVPFACEEPPVMASAGRDDTRGLRIRDHVQTVLLSFDVLSERRGELNLMPFAKVVGPIQCDVEQASQGAARTVRSDDEGTVYVVNLP